MGIVADRDDLVVYGETVMWKKVEDKKLVLPLERKLARGMHEVTSWWLLDSGVRYLMGLKGEGKKAV